VEGEDGIRHWSVTGVQAWALPISVRSRRLFVTLAGAALVTAVIAPIARADDQPRRDPLTLVRERLEVARQEANELAQRIAAAERSEERRVGEGGRRGAGAD